MKSSRWIGMMSGSSLDGLDIAVCSFEWENKLPKGLKWHLETAHTLAYSTEWQKRLFELPDQSALELAQTHVDFGHYIGGLCQQFIQDHQVEVAYIASHGHTIFHYPDRQMSLQIGDGAAIAAKTGHPVVCDFRSVDMALGGQGAPLAPLADQVLLPGYDFYLNLGGIANISYPAQGRYVAFDIGPANQVLNALVAERGLAFDEGGQIAATGQLHPTLLQQVNDIDYFQQAYPKSLDNRWILRRILPIYQSIEAPLPDKLRTACEQLAQQIATAMQQILKKEASQAKANYRLLATGGGAFNDFLLDCIRKACQSVGSVEIVVPDAKIISFKEAALMALMGLLRVEGLPNCMPGVTGASGKAIGGAIYLPPQKLSSHDK